MIAIVFMYGAFGVHLSYLLIDRGLRVYKEVAFWQVLSGLLATYLLTERIFA